MGDLSRWACADHPCDRCAVCRAGRCCLERGASPALKARIAQTASELFALMAFEPSPDDIREVREAAAQRFEPEDPPAVDEAAGVADGYERLALPTATPLTPVAPPEQRALPPAHPLALPLPSIDPLTHITNQLKRSNDQ